MPSSNRALPSPADLASRLRFALDRIELVRGHPMPFHEIQESLASEGISLSRARWAYMLRGDDTRIRDKGLLVALSRALDVPEDYLYDGELSTYLRAQLDLVTAMRTANVKAYAARALGDLAPEAVSAIAQVLDDIQQEDSAENA